MPASSASQPTELSDYPRPSVAVDVAVLTVADDNLRVLAVEHRLGGLALPGTFLHPGELLADAAARALAEKAHLDDVEFSQLHVFDALDRDERGWVLSVGHSGAVAHQRISPDAIVVPIIDGKPRDPLMFDHDEIVRSAVLVLRQQYSQQIDPAGLLRGPFTILQLRLLYQAVFGHALMKDTFRRIVIPHLVATGELANDFGRPAELFAKVPGAVLPASAGVTFVDPRVR